VLINRNAPHFQNLVAKSLHSPLGKKQMIGLRQPYLK